MNKMKIILVGSSDYFESYLNALKDYFLTLNHEVEILKHYHNEPSDLVVVINPLKQYPNLKMKQKNTVYACIQTEQLHNSNDGGFEMTWKYVNRLKKIQKRYDLIFDWSSSHVASFKLKYPHMHHIHHGIYEALGPKVPSVKEKEYDLCFIGNPTGIDQRRNHFLNRLKEKYKVYPKHDNIWGQEKTEALAKSKICLNIHYDHALSFESPRMYEYFHNKCFVMSEYIYDSTPFEEGVHYISFDENNLEALIDHYLNNEDLRDKIALSAYKKAHDYPLEKTAFKILQLVRVKMNDKKLNKQRLRFKSMIKETKKKIRKMFK